MNKLVLISDMHLSTDNPVARLDNCKEAGYKKLQYVLDWAQQEKAIVLQAGDVCDKARSWHLLSDLQNIFLPEDRFYCVYGQHDVVMYNEATKRATILGVLAGSGIITILNSKPTIEGEYAIYGCHYGQEIPVVQDESMFNILVIHAPIAQQALWPGHNYWDALSFLKKHDKYRLIVCGDIHQKFCVDYKGRYIVNSGAMIRREATIYNFSHHPGFWVWDGKLNWQEIPHAPAEQVLTRDHIDYKEMAEGILDEFIDKMRVDNVDTGVSFMDNLWQFIRSNGINDVIIGEIADIIGKEKFYDKSKNR